MFNLDRILGRKLQKKHNNLKTQKLSAGHTINTTDPFEEQSTILFGNRELSPYVNRLRMMWDSFRAPILEHFPSRPKKPANIKTYLAQIDDIYTSDAYHSLSIEGVPN